MLPPKVYWPLFYYLLLFFIPGPAFAVLCPRCETGNLYCGEQSILCSKCNCYYHLEQFLPFIEGGNVPAYEGGIISGHSDFSVPGSIPLHNALSDEQVSHLVAYVQSMHPEVNTAPQFVFNALAAAELTSRTTELFEVSDVDTLLAIWWLTGYWLLYQDGSTRSQAESFLNGAPEALNISQALQQINHLHPVMQNHQRILDLEFLFLSGMTLQASHALHAINLLAATASAAPLAFQVRGSGGIIFVAYSCRFYCIFTPFGHHYMVKKAETVARVLARISNASHIAPGTARAALQVAGLALFGGALGAIFGMPFVIASSLAGVDPQMTMAIYGVLITTAAAAFAANQPYIFLSRGVLDDIPECPQAD